MVCLGANDATGAEKEASFVHFFKRPFWGSAIRRCDADRTLIVSEALNAWRSTEESYLCPEKRRR